MYLYNVVKLDMKKVNCGFCRVLTFMNRKFGLPLTYY